MSKFSLCNRNYYPWIFLIIIVIVWAFLFWCLDSPPEVYFAAVAAVAGFVHFLYAEHNHTTDRFIALFAEFNRRYDCMNGSLNKLYEDLSPDKTLLSVKEKSLLYDYFNLCAEEYLYYKAGYIDEDVWKAWLSGMKFFADNPVICDLWVKELGSDSYYGFKLDIVGGKVAR